MDRSEIKETLRLLFTEWTWENLSRRRGIRNLIVTQQGYFRKDNAVVQNVGKPAVKFRFDLGPWPGMTSTKTPRHFSISTTVVKDRIRWMAMPEGNLFIQQRTGGVWQPPFEVTDLFDNPGQDISDDELDMADVLMFGGLKQIVELLPGLRGVDKALQERFYGKGY